MLYKGQRVDKKQTRIIEHSSQPIYEQTFDFDILTLIQQYEPMDNVNFAEYSTTTTTSTQSSPAHNLIDPRIASRIQFVLLVMDWDRVEKSDVLGKIELSTQHRQQRLWLGQQQQSSLTNSSQTSGWFNYPMFSDTPRIEKQTLFSPTHKPKLNKAMRLNEICIDEDDCSSTNNNENDSLYSLQRRGILPRRKASEVSEISSFSTTTTTANTNSSKTSRQHNWYDIFYEPDIPIMCAFQIENF